MGIKEKISSHGFLSFLPGPCGNQPERKVPGAKGELHSTGADYSGAVPAEGEGIDAVQVFPDKGAVEGENGTDDEIRIVRNID